MISGHTFMYLTRSLRSLMKSLFLKFRAFTTNRILLTTVLLWRAVPYFYLKIPEGFSKVIFHPGWLLLKVLQQIRPCSKSERKKTVELFQLMLIGCLYKYLRTYFWRIWRSLLLVKLHAFPLNSTGCRFLRVYFRA